MLKPIPADLSIGFGDYCWYYTYNSGAYIGNKSKQFYNYLFSSDEKPKATETKK